MGLHGFAVFTLKASALRSFGTAAWRQWKALIYDRGCIREEQLGCCSYGRSRSNWAIRLQAGSTFLKTLLALGTCLKCFEAEALLHECISAISLRIRRNAHIIYVSLRVWTYLTSLL